VKTIFEAGRKGKMRNDKFRRTFESFLLAEMRIRPKKMETKRMRKQILGSLM
jgi:hypothetical protein